LADGLCPDCREPTAIKKFIGRKISNPRGNNKMKEIVYRHNKHGLIAINDYQTGVDSTKDILPYSLIIDDNEEGWSQHGVYATQREAEQAKQDYLERYGRTGDRIEIWNTLEVLKGVLDDDETARHKAVFHP